MGAPVEGIVVCVITGLVASDLDGYGEDGDRFTGEPCGDCCTATGGVGAGRDGCIELRFGGDGGTAGIELNVSVSCEKFEYATQLSLTRQRILPILKLLAAVGLRAQGGGSCSISPDGV